MFVQFRVLATAAFSSFLVCIGQLVPLAYLLTLLEHATLEKMQRSVGFAPLFNAKR